MFYVPFTLVAKYLILVLFHENRTCRLEVHGGTEETSRDGGNQGVDAGNILPLHLSF